MVGRDRHCGLKRKRARVLGISLPIQTSHSGCWDTNGLRYNKGAGTNHFPANGGHACQLINGNMICP